MEEIRIDMREEYIKMADAYSRQKSIESRKENNRKDIDLLLEVLGLHTVTKSISESSSCDFVVCDDIDRLTITKKLIDKIKLL